MKKFNKLFHVSTYTFLVTVVGVVLPLNVFADAAVSTIGSYLQDKYIGGETDRTLIRYGNWFGPGWWGGSELDKTVGMLAPIDSLDAVAQKHDFGYKVAEFLGKARLDIEARYKAIADAIAARDAFALSTDPAKWPIPASNPTLAKTYLERIKLGFPNYQQKLNEIKSKVPNYDYITDKDLIELVGKEYPDDKKFEAMVDTEVRSWKIQYEKLKKKKGLEEKEIVTPLPAATECGKKIFPNTTKYELHAISVGKNSGKFVLNYAMGPYPDRIVVEHENMVLHDSGCVTGEKAVTLAYAGNTPIIKVKIFPSCGKEFNPPFGWSFKVNCPE